MHEETHAARNHAAGRVSDLYTYRYRCSRLYTLFSCSFDSWLFIIISIHFIFIYLIYRYYGIICGIVIINIWRKEICSLSYAALVHAHQIDRCFRRYIMIASSLFVERFLNDHFCSYFYDKHLFLIYFFKTIYYSNIETTKSVNIN